MSNVPIIGGLIKGISNIISPEAPPTVSAPPPPSPTSSSPEVKAATTTAADDAAAKERAQAKGQAATMLTGGAGLDTPAPVSKSVLLGS